MISYTTYRLIHILGILILFLALGGLGLRARDDEGRSDARGRRLVAATHGIGLFVVLLGGFGMLARLGITDGFPGWIWAKLTIWGVLGASLLLPRFVPALARPLWLIVPLLGTTAAYMALYKPF